MSKPSVFISYSQKDEKWKDRLISHLSGLQNSGRLDVWSDQRIRGSDDWYQEIEKAIQTSNIAIFLITANFLSSKFISKEEIPQILDKYINDGLNIYSIIIKPCDWQAYDWIKRFQVRPLKGRPLSKGDENQIDENLTFIAKEIRELLDRIGIPHEETIYQHLPPEQISLSSLPTTQQALFGRENELKLLDKAWADPHAHIISFVAWGGVGKTALVNEWLSQMEKQNYRGAQRVYGWSFYSQGTQEDKQASADTFFDDALKWFGYEGEPIKSPWDKGKQLADLIRQSPTLLILDGLEPLQYPPGTMKGELRDQGMKALLKELSRMNNGLCVISTRCEVRDIEHTVGKTIHRICLDNLSDEAGIQLLKYLNIKGTEKELRETCKDFGGHALALNLLGNYLATVHEGEIRKRDLLPGLIDDEEQGGHAKRVLESYEIWLKGKPELDILYLMGLFDRPAPQGAIDALREPPAIQGLTGALENISQAKWQFALKHLRELHLLAEKTPAAPNTLDCHPLIREHFAEKLKAKSKQAWQEAHSRLYDYYKNVPVKELPDTLEEMEPLFAAVAHGCQAGDHTKAWEEIYYPKINRGSEAYCENKLGAFGVHLSALSSFFEEPWSKPATEFSESIKAVAFNYAGYGLRALGRLHEAVQPLQAGMENNINQQNWPEAAKNAGNLSELFLTSGNVRLAITYARQSVDFADNSKDEFIRETARTWIANASHQEGKHSEALKRFQEAENMQRERTPEYIYRYSQSGFQFCDLLLNQGKVQEILERYQKFVEWRLPSDSLLTHALEELSAGRAYLLQELTSSSVPLSQRGTTGGFEKAANHLNQAVTGLREAGAQEFIARGLFARAFLYRIQHEFTKAWEDLIEAQEISERGGMKLWLVDYHLEAARLCLAEYSVKQRATHLEGASHVQQATEHIQIAKNLVKETGYHRRDPELLLLKAQLAFAKDDIKNSKQWLKKAKTKFNEMTIRMWDWEVQALEEKLK